MKPNEKFIIFLKSFFDSPLVNVISCVFVLALSFACVVFHQERVEKDLTPTKEQIEWEKSRKFVFVINGYGDRKYRWELFQINDKTGKLSYKSLLINHERIPHYQKYCIGDTITLNVSYEWLLEKSLVCDYHSELYELRPHYETPLWPHEILLLVICSAFGIVITIVTIISALVCDEEERRDTAEFFLYAMFAFSVLSVSISFLFK